MGSYDLWRIVSMPSVAGRGSQDVTVEAEYGSYVWVSMPSVAGRGSQDFSMGGRADLNVKFQCPL